jgi:hypothetical protein
MATVTARRRRAIERAVATDHARDLVTRAIFEVVGDALDLGPIAVRSADDRAWVRYAIAGPIQELTRVEGRRVRVDVLRTVGGSRRPPTGGGNPGGLQAAFGDGRKYVQFNGGFQYKCALIPLDGVKDLYRIRLCRGRLLC